MYSYAKKQIEYRNRSFAVDEVLIESIVQSHQLVMQCDDDYYQEAERTRRFTVVRHLDHEAAVLNYIYNHKQIKLHLNLKYCVACVCVF